MKKRILALVLALATLVTTLSVVASAVPYSPSANAWKDFGQAHYYFHEVNKGSAAPKADGKITDADGYGEPIATFGLRYVTTVDNVKENLSKGEYKIRDDGNYYVYPTTETHDEVWKSITSFEVDDPHCYIYTYRYQATSYSSSSSYYYAHPKTHEFIRAYKVTKSTFKKYTALNSAGYITLDNAKLLESEPANWKTNFADYFTKADATGYSAVVGTGTDEKTAPAWKADTYYSGEKIVVTELFTTASSGTAGSVATLDNLIKFRVILPEKVNVYARYNNQYLYYAIEVVEDDHKSAYYNLYSQYGTNMSNSPASYANGCDYGSYYRKSLKGELSSDMSATIRTYANIEATLKTTAPILAKFGNPDATYNELQKAGTDYNVTHTPYTPPAEGSEDAEGDGFSDFEEEGEADFRTSGTYGTTVYEYRVPWAVINGKYSPDTSKTAVPEMFNILSEIQLENRLGGSAYRLSLAMPRTTGHLPGGVARSGANYPTDLSVFRYMDNAGIIDEEDYGTYNFRWLCTSTTGMWTQEYHATDYYTIGSKLTFTTVPQYPPMFFTAGQEPAEEYAVPEYVGTQIRADGAEGQKMRIKFAVPGTEKEIAEAGVIVAPTEVARRQQLKLGITSIRYYAEENPVLFGVVDGKWMNLTTDSKKYFGNSATPNDSESYIAYDVYGGKPSGIYTVYTLAADLENPYEEKRDLYGNEKTIYTVVFGGANGEGLFNDFDDYNTFYTIRPYVKYADGNVVYGEHEYKSLYYLACWQIQDIIDEYNSSHGYSADSDTRKANAYNMDKMPLATVKDAAGNVIKDAQGNSIYLPATNTSTTGSPYFGAAEYSLYQKPRRDEIFLWYAVKLLSRNNSNTPLRFEEYDKFDANTKLLVDQYAELLENIWQVVETAENNRYYTKPLQ